MRPVLPIFGLLLATAACSAGSTSSPSPPPDAPAAIEIQPSLERLPHDDPRLGPVFAELRAHPEWLDEPIASPTVEPRAVDGC